MKSWKFGLKIGFGVGFGCLIGSAMVLGGLGVLSMQHGKTILTALGEQYNPATVIAGGIARTALRTMFALHGTSLSLEPRCRDQAKAEITLVRQALVQARV